MTQQLSLFLSRRSKPLQTGQRPKGPTPLRSLHPNSFSHKNQSRKITQSISLTPLKQTVVESNNCRSCSSSRSGSCRGKQHLTTTVSLPLLRSPTVVRQVSYHWQTVQRLTLKSQQNRVVLNREFGTQTSTEESSEKPTLDFDADEQASLERPNVERRRLSTLGAVGSTLRNSFRSSRKAFGSLATLQGRLSSTKMTSSTAARFSHRPGTILI